MEQLSQDVIDWYAIRGKDIPKMIEPHRMPQGVTSEQVQIAAIKFIKLIESDDFDKRRLKLKSGRTLKYLDIVWEVWTMAREVNAEDFIKDQAKLRNASKTILDMDDKHRTFAVEATRANKRLRVRVAVVLWVWLAKELIICLL